MAELFAKYYAQYAKNLTSESASRRALQFWLEYFKEENVSVLSDISKQERFHEWMRTEKGVNTGTIIRYVTVGKAALNWAYKRGQLATVPFVLTPKPVASEPMGKPLTKEEIRLLLKHAKHQHLKDFIVMLVATLECLQKSGPIFELVLASNKELNYGQEI